MLFKDVPIGGVFQLVKDGPFHVKKTNETYDDDRFCPPKTGTIPPSTEVVASEISDTLLGLLKFYQHYHSLPEEQQRHVRHVVYQRTGRFGKAFFQNVAPIMEDWFSGSRDSKPESGKGSEGSKATS